MWCFYGASTLPVRCFTVPVRCFAVLCGVLRCVAMLYLLLRVRAPDRTWCGAGTVRDVRRAPSLDARFRRFWPGV